MELFFILMLIGVVGVFLYTGSTAVFGKVIGPLIVIVFILGMCAHEKMRWTRRRKKGKNGIKISRKGSNGRTMRPEKYV